MQRQEIEQETFMLWAVVGPGSHTNAKYSFSLAGWSLDDCCSSMIFSRKIPLNFQDAEIYRAVQDLENILLALFVNDRLPRKIFYFSYPKSLPKDIQVRLIFMLGQPKDGPAADQEITKESFSHSGFWLNRRLDQDQDWIASNSDVKEWFDLFHSKEALAGSIVLLQKSFWTINGLSGKYRYYDYLDLCEAVVLMIAGLESLFVQGASGEISVQFKLVGSAYYTKFVRDADLEGFDQTARKLSFTQMKTLLGHLYDIRSAVAHGQARSLFAGKKTKWQSKWQQILRCMNVGDREPQDKTWFFSHVLLALGFAQKHIFAMISHLNEHPIRGIAMLDDLIAEDTVPRLEH
jgi:hypothetical protein